MADGTTALGFPIAATDRLADLIWASDAHVETQKALFWSEAGMMAKDRGGEPVFERRPGVPIIIRDEFKKRPGEQMLIRMRMQLTNTPRTDSTTYGTNSMLGSEQDLAYRDLQVYLSLLKNSVGFDSPDWLFHRTSADLEGDAQDALREWLTENHEEAIADAFYEKFPYFAQQANSLTAVNHINLYYVNGRGNAQSMTDTDLISERELRRIRSFCVNRKLNPIKVDGRKCFVMLVDPFVLADLQADAQFRESAGNAHERGSDNPIVKGAHFEHLNLLIWEYDRQRRTTTGAHTGNLGRLFVLGADAIAVAYGSEPRLVPRVETNYGDRWGLAIRQVFGASRADFRNQAATATTNQSSAEWIVWEDRDEFAS